MTEQEIMTLATLAYKKELKPNTGFSISDTEACFLGAACYQKVKHKNFHTADFTKILKVSWPFVYGTYHAFDDPKDHHVPTAFKDSQRRAFERGWNFGLKARKKFLTPKA